MPHILVQIMSQMTSLSEEEEAAIEACFPLQDFPSGAYLLREGQVAHEGYYVVKGCIRAFELIDGEEKTTVFFTEGYSAVDFQSQATGKPSSQNFVCQEDSTVAIVNQEKEQQLYEQFPRFEAFCRSGMEEMMGNQQAQMARFIIMSPKERYLNLLQARPELIRRVPQYQLASFLGVKPETLSRIRRRIATES